MAVVRFDLFLTTVVSTRYLPQEIPRYVKGKNNIGSAQPRLYNTSAVSSYYSGTWINLLLSVPVAHGSIYCYWIAAYHLECCVAQLSNTVPNQPNDSDKS